MESSQGRLLDTCVQMDGTLSPDSRTTDSPGGRSPSRTGCGLSGPLWKVGRSGTVRIDSPPFSLEHTLASGQCFRWRNVGKAFVGVVFNHLVRIQQDGNTLRYQSIPPGLPSRKLKAYLGLNGVHAAAIRSLPDDPLLLEALERFRGMRLLRQDPWETLISFIISANNNIPRIRRCIEKLCRAAGQEIRAGCSYYTFPTPEALAHAPLATLQGVCNLGYRHNYVSQTAREVLHHPDLISDVVRMPYADARKQLMRFPGVGPKVADCVLLYSMGKWEAFPVDTWILKIVRDNYFKGERPSPSKLRAFARERFGPFAGYAQLYLFRHALDSRP